MSVNTQFENAGDALINRELARLISDRVPLTIDLSRAPDFFVQSLGLDRYSNCEKVTGRRGLIRLLASVVRARVQGHECFYFLNPGGLGRKRRTSQHLKALVYDFILLILKIIGVRICLVGVSYDRMGWTDVVMLRIRVWLVAKHWVRDSTSLDYLKSVGIRRLSLVPDLSFNLYSEMVEGRAGMCVALSFRFDGDDGADIGTLTRDLSAILLDFDGRPSVKCVVQVKRDEEKMRALHEFISNDLGLESSFHLVYDNVDSALESYIGCAVIYSNRLHALLAAAYMGCKPFPLLRRDRNVKIRALFEDLGLGYLLLDAGSASVSSNSAEKDWRNLFVREYKSLAGAFDELLSHNRSGIRK